MPMYRYQCPFCLEERDEYRKIAERDQAKAALLPARVRHRAPEIPNDF